MSSLWIVGIASPAVLIWNAARARLMIVTVIGDSMVPALADGDRLLVLRCGADSVARGRIVLVKRPDPVGGWGGAGGAWIKRAVAAPGDHVPRSVAPATTSRVPADWLVVVDDHPASEDSRSRAAPGNTSHARRCHTQRCAGWRTEGKSSPGGPTTATRNGIGPHQFAAREVRGRGKQLASVFQ